MKLVISIAAVLAIGSLTGCSRLTSKSPADVSATIRASLENAGLKAVSVNQDNEKGVVTLGGHVDVDGEKSKAAEVARSLAPGLVISNEIAVVTPGSEGASKTINSDLDKGIESNLHAELVKHKLNDHVSYSVKNHVVTLTGEVRSQTSRARAEALATAVPNVQQVVNELQIKVMKATSSSN